MNLRFKLRRKENSDPGFSGTAAAGGKGRIIGFLFGLPFFLAGAGFCWFGAIQPLLQVAESRSWPELPCRIVSSEVETNSSSDGDTYKVAITFAYSFEGRNYSGGSYNFSDWSSSGYKGKAKTVRNYPAGSEATCWVDPDDPETAVLSRDIPGIVFFLIPFTSIFMIIGGAIMLGSLGLLPKAWKPHIRSRHKPVTATDSGEGALKPKLGAKGKLVGAICIAAFWNGIVGVFLWQVLKDVRNGRPEWLLVLFLIPFVLVGIGFIAAVVYYLLALGNPRFRLVLAEASPRLGQTTRLRWVPAGSLRRLKDLRIVLEGRESATYRRGTKSVTDRSCFHRQVLYETDNPGALAQSECDLAVPADSMHSFNGGNNKIEWALKLEGAIDRWPDVNDSYPLTVRPLQRGTAL